MGVGLCGKKYGFFRDVSRKSTKVRTDQARKSAMLRIVTGKTNFLIKKPGNEETRNGKRMANHGWTRMNTDSEKTLNRSQAELETNIGKVGNGVVEFWSIGGQGCREAARTECTPYPASGGHFLSGNWHGDW